VGAQRRGDGGAGLAAIGGRPVKVTLARPQVFNNTTHRPATIQRIRIGADRDGKILAIGHESWSGDLPGGGPETAANQTRLLYAGKDRMTAHRLAVLDLPEGNAMRAPGEAPGLLALEIAMDELAEQLKLDPVELRIRNDVQFDPEAGPKRPFSHRDLIGCLKTGAERFGWDKRNPTPGQVRDGRWLVGMGMAAAFRNNITMKSGARVGVDAKGVVTVATDMTDIGTGSYTVIAQTAAEMMGVPIDKVVVLLGDSSFPVSAGSGGQWGGNSSTSGVYAACVKLREAVAQKAGLTRRRRCSRTARSRRAARACPWPRSRAPPACRPRTAWSSATWARNTPSRPSAPTSPRSGSMRTPARSACGGWAGPSRPAASSIPSRPAAR
jgi:xanthine dehydrogenase YagR molybdenum-binding subunit